eukprot:Selendium_serpulae@DN4718_c0_g1_i2.p1
MVIRVNSTVNTCFAIDHCPVEVPNAQFNSLLLDINPHLRDEKEKFLPTIRAANGTIPLMPGSEALTLGFEMQKSQVEHMPHIQHVHRHSQPVTLPVVPHPEKAHHQQSQSRGMIETQHEAGHYQQQPAHYHQNVHTAGSTPQHEAAQ